MHILIAPPPRSPSRIKVKKHPVRTKANNNIFITYNIKEKPFTEFQKSKVKSSLGFNCSSKFSPYI